eukprot:SAG31_NODE_2887_length_4948_cov_3.419468_4_plen_110_part_00
MLLPFGLQAFIAYICLAILTIAIIMTGVDGPTKIMKIVVVFGAGVAQVGCPDSVVFRLKNVCTITSRSSLLFVRHATGLGLLVLHRLLHPLWPGWCACLQMLAMLHRLR